MNTLNTLRGLLIESLLNEGFARPSNKYNYEYAKIKPQMDIKAKFYDTKVKPYLDKRSDDYRSRSFDFEKDKAKQVDLAGQVRARRAANQENLRNKVGRGFIRGLKTVGRKLVRKVFPSKKGLTTGTEALSKWHRPDPHKSLHTKRTWESMERIGFCLLESFNSMITEKNHRGVNPLTRPPVDDRDDG